MSGFRWKGGLLAAVLTLAALALFTAACNDQTTYIGPRPPQQPPIPKFRTHGDYFQIDRRQGKGWEPFIVKGVNLAVATPGRYPGELAATRADYLRWLDGISAVGANVVRIYTLHYPVFYQAFRDWNLAHPTKPLYMMHGIWLDEREEGDFITDSTKDFEAEIRMDIDAIHGNAVIAERFGKASGRYTADASPWLMCWLPGDEMDGHIVANSDEEWAGYNVYNGRFLHMPKGGKPMEGWIAHQMDNVLSYEYDRYGALRPIGWSSWPALDAIHHPTETPNFGQDVVDCNFAKFEMIPPFDQGLFASYHIYPFNPEFIIYDPVYQTTKTSAGVVSSYLGYMKDLKAHHPGVPVLVAEYGIPSSQGNAHKNPWAYDHGGYNEVEQADIIYDLYHNCREAGMAGTVVFEWIDEWFKRTWVTTPTMLPGDRGALWLDVMSPEENFGVMSYYPLPGWSKILDGKVADWNDKDFWAAKQPAAPVQGLGDGGDAARTLVAVQVASDPAYVYLRLQFATDAVPDLDKLAVLIGLSTVEGALGNRKLGALHTPQDTTLTTVGDLGFESMVLLDGATRELRVDSTYSPMAKINGASKLGGIPQLTTDGSFILEKQLVNNNAQYEQAGILIGGEPWPIPPKQYHAWGTLRTGDWANDSLAHLQVGEGGQLEIRLPWHALWFTDPSSRSILWDDPATPAWDIKTTQGIRVFVATAVKSPTGYRLVDAAPRNALTAKGIAAAEVPLYSWPTWDSVDHFVERKKLMFYALRTAFAEDP